MVPTSFRAKAASGLLSALVTSVLTAFGLQAIAEEPGSGSRPRTDFNGDPLPEGAVARMGTARVKHAGLSSLAYSPDGRHQLGIKSLVITADGSRVITAGGRDGTARSWELLTGKPLQVYRKKELADAGAEFHGIALSPDSKTFVLANAGDPPLTLWDAEKGNLLRTIVPKSNGVTIDVVFCPDGKRLIEAQELDDTLRLWDVASQKQIRTFTMSRAGNSGIAVSPDGFTLAAVGDSLCIWQIADGKLLHRLDNENSVRYPRRGHEVAFSPEGLLLGVLETRTNKITVRLIEATTGKEIAAHEVGSFSHGEDFLAFSHNGRSFAVALDAEIHVLDTITGSVLHTFTGHLEKVTGLAFSPDDKVLVSCSEDSTALVWDTSDLVSDAEPALKRDEMKSLWQDFSGDDGLKAYAAYFRMQHFPKDVLPLLAKEIPPINPVARARVDGLVADLDSDDFDKRENASNELSKVGDYAENSLQTALNHKPSVEAGFRIQALLDKLMARASVVSRTIALLESMNTTESRRLIEELAKGSAESRQVRAAKAALERLAARK